ncbi:MAG: alpha/beta fold hydrolase [Armatimonadota bacterium]
MATEQHVQFASGDCLLRGILHTPDAECNRRAAFVFCPPFAEERKCAHRVLVRCARRFCDLGFSVLRFDLSGTGESEGAAADAAPDRWREDVHAAIAFVREAVGARHVGLLGLRLGASLSAQVAAERDDVQWLVLWEPVVNGPRYLSLNLRRSLIKQMLTQGKDFEATRSAAASEAGPRDTDFDGHRVSAACQEQISQIDLTSLQRLTAPHVLLLHIGPREVLSKECQAFLDHLRTLAVNVTAEAVREQPFWNLIGLVEGEAAVSGTVNWLNSSASDEGADCARTPDAGRQPAVRCVSRDAPMAPVTFTSRGSKLFGMLHRPDSVGPDAIGAILLHGWSGNRRGPHDMLVAAAAACCVRGMPALRFDFRGRGDSEGALFEANLATMIEDTECAARMIREMTGVKRLALIGICSGCEVAIGAAPLIPQVQALALWSAPMVAASRAATRRRKQLANLAEYGRKLFRAETWRKAFTGRLNVDLIKRAVTGKGGAGESPGEDGERAAPQPDIPWRERFAACPRHVLFIYGGNDPVTPDAEAHYRRMSQRDGHDARFHRVSGANHSFFSLDWKREVIEVTLDWLRELQPTSSA